MGKGANVVAVAAAGFIAGMLLAPKSGKETRKDIMDKAHDAKRAAGEKTEHLKEHMKDGMHVLHKGATDVSSEVADFANSTKRRANRVKGEEKGMFEEAKARAERISDASRNNDTKL
jgi:gas vesicle protein